MTVAETTIYLLLKDGTIRDGIPVAPDEMDVSRLASPRAGEVGQVATAGRQEFSGGVGRPARTTSSRSKARSDDARQVWPEARPGATSSGSTTGNFVTGSSYRLWGRHVLRRGRLSEGLARRLQTTAASAQTLNDMPTSTRPSTTTGATSSASTPGVFVGSVKKNKRRPSNRGAYALNGYILTLRHDNGKTERLPFFLSSADGKLLYFEGSICSKTGRSSSRGPIL